MREPEDFTQTVARRLAQIEQHLIQLIIPVQQIGRFISISDLNENFLASFRDAIHSTLFQAKEEMECLHDAVKTIQHNISLIENMEISQTLGEIRYLGEKLAQIDKRLLRFEKEGIDRNLQLDIKVDGVSISEEKLPKKRVMKKITSSKKK